MKNILIFGLVFIYVRLFSQDTCNSFISVVECNSNYPYLQKESTVNVPCTSTPKYYNSYRKTYGNFIVYTHGNSCNVEMIVKDSFLRNFYKDTVMMISNDSVFIENYGKKVLIQHKNFSNNFILFNVSNMAKGYKIVKMHYVPKKKLLVNNIEFYQFKIYLSSFEITEKSILNYESLRSVKTREKRKSMSKCLFSKYTGFVLQQNGEYQVNLNKLKVVSCW